MNTNLPRCSKHKTEAKMPNCPTCKRISLERTICREIVEALTADGFALTLVTLDYGEGEEPFSYDLLFDLDECSLVARKGNTVSFVFFVFGNDGWDVVCDYTMGLDTLITNITDKYVPD